MGVLGRGMPIRNLLPFILAACLAPAGSAAERALAIDQSQSRIDIAVKATVDSFVGRLDAYQSSITLAEDGNIAGARLDFRFRDVVTGKEGRDKAMHKWQQTDAFPEGAFVLNSLEPADGANAMATGRLTFHGVTREMRFPVFVNRDGMRYAIDGDATLDTREFGLPVIRMMGLLKVDPMVHVRFHLQGLAEPATTSTHAAR